MLGLPHGKHGQIINQWFGPLPMTHILRIRLQSQWSTSYPPQTWDFFAHFKGFHGDFVVFFPNQPQEAPNKRRAPSQPSNSPKRWMFGFPPVELLGIQNGVTFLKDLKPKLLGLWVISWLLVFRMLGPFLDTLKKNWTHDPGTWDPELRHDFGVYTEDMKTSPELWTQIFPPQIVSFPPTTLHSTGHSHLPTLRRRSCSKANSRRCSTGMLSASARSTKGSLPQSFFASSNNLLGVGVRFSF